MTAYRECAMRDDYPEPPKPAVDLYPYLSLEDATFAGRYYKELFK